MIAVVPQLLVLACTGTGVSLQGPAPPPAPRAVVERVRAAGAELGNVVRYAVERDLAEIGVEASIARTIVTLAREPFRFRADGFRADGGIVERVLGDSEEARTLRGGEEVRAPTFASTSPREKRMPVLCSSHLDVAATWRLFLDDALWAETLAQGRFLFVRDEEIDGDPCHVVLVLRDSEALAGTTSEYVWVSRKSGLPRAVQRLTLVRGRTRLSPRFRIRDLTTSVADEADPFTVALLGAEAQVGGEPSAGPDPIRVGEPAGAFALRDLENVQVVLSDVLEGPTVVTLWATWCGPCLAEHQALGRIRSRLDGGFDVFAIAVRDSRADAVRHARKNPLEGFRFLTDPDMQHDRSLLMDAVSPGSTLIPVSFFVDSAGVVRERWSGFKNEEELESRIRRLLPETP